MEQKVLSIINEIRKAKNLAILEKLNVEDNLPVIKIEHIFF